MIRTRRLSRIVSCEECNAPKWERCISVNGKPLDLVHRVRIVASRKVVTEKGSAYLQTVQMKLTQ